MGGTFLYMLLAFVVGLLLGWFLWGRLRGEMDRLRANLDSTHSELEACGRARADLLERQRQGAGDSDETAAKAPPAPAALMQVPPTAVSPAPAPVATPARAKADTPAPARLRSAKRDAAPARAKADTPAPARLRGAKRNATPAQAKTDTASGRLVATGSSRKDNLRRLIGVGPVNERRLNEHGITTFAQIAAWTAADVKKAEEYLRFDGRIERERWVDQAKLLAVGDEKEFARRFPKAGDPSNV